MKKETDETLPEYYTQSYKDTDTFSSIQHNTYVETKYSGKEYRALFMYWYKRIKPHLDFFNQHRVHEILLEWNQETLAKFDMYSLVRNYFESNKQKKESLPTEDQVLSVIFSTDIRGIELEDYARNFKESEVYYKLVNLFTKTKI